MQRLLLFVKMPVYRYFFHKKHPKERFTNSLPLFCDFTNEAKKLFPQIFQIILRRTSQSGVVRHA